MNKQSEPVAELIRKRPLATFGVVIGLFTGASLVNSHNLDRPTDAAVGSDISTELESARRGTRTPLDIRDLTESPATSSLRRGSRSEYDAAAASLELPMTTARRGSREMDRS
jgi:hypothetical protein